VQYHGDILHLRDQFMSWIATNISAALLLPPLNLLLLALAGLLLWRKNARLAFALLSCAFLLLWLCATPFVAESLLHTLEEPAPALNKSSAPAEAIVVLGGGTYFNAPEYAGDTVSDSTLQRLRYAAKLYRKLGKPLLLTGGAPRGNRHSEASLMSQVLQEEFNTPVKWLEEQSNNTLESARYSFLLLHQAGIRRIYLVTHAWHIPRAVRAFQAAGFEVVAAPMAFTTRYQTDLLAFMPSATALKDSTIYLHEVIGLLWYRLKS
jgi:uncharacterized SAM-binding protein YcdF (DUF218 family)